MRILNLNLVIKISMLFFWIAVIFIFLYSPLLKKDLSHQTINILTWGDMISLNSIKTFEKQTGIKINLNYYETNEELFAKLHVTKGKEYDLITITDYGVEYLKNKNLLQKIDKTKLTFWNDIDNKFLSNYYDPKNEYTIPYCWDIYGLGINKKFFENQIPNSWQLIFDKKLLQGKISMTDDSYIAILIAGQYLFGNIAFLDKTKLKEIEKLLVDQKNWIEIYTDLRPDYILKMGICPVVVAQSAYIARVIKENKNLEFLIPKEGGFKIIDLMVISKYSNKNEQIYKFLNFLYQENQIRKFFNKFGYLPVLKKVLESVDLNYLGGSQKILSPEFYSKLSFFNSNISVKEINKIWTMVKA